MALVARDQSDDARTSTFGELRRTGCQATSFKMALLENDSDDRLMTYAYILLYFP
jgi:hypothetical protein